MRMRLAASAAVFVVVALVSAPWLQSEPTQEVPHFNAGPPAKGEKLPPILTRDQLLGTERSISVSDACLRIGGQDSQGALSAAVLLLLRPQHGAQEPA